MTDLPIKDAVARADASFTLLQAEPVETPCGRYADVLKVSKKTADKTFDLWFARGVGLVKRTCRETGMTETLVSYK